MNFFFQAWMETFSLILKWNCTLYLVKLMWLLWCRYVNEYIAGRIDTLYLCRCVAVSRFLVTYRNNAEKIVHLNWNYDVFDLTNEQNRTDNSEKIARSLFRFDYSMNIWHHLCTESILFSFRLLRCSYHSTFLFRMN